MSISGFLCSLLILSSFLHRSVNLPPDTNQSSVRQTRLSRQGIYIYYWRKRPVREGWGAPKKGFWLTTTFPSNETFLCNDSRKANKSIPYVGEDFKNMRPWILVITIHVIFKATKLHIIIYKIKICTTVQWATTDQFQSMVETRGSSLIRRRGKTRRRCFFLSGASL